MALSKEEKDALEAHYRGKDLYDPSKEPGQAPPSFQPAMCRGGEMGYAEGGPVMLADGGYAEDSGMADAPESSYITPEQQRAQAEANLASHAAADPTAQASFEAEAAPAPRPAAPVASGAALPPPPASLPPQNAPAASQAVPRGFSGAEFSQLMQYLQPSAGKRFGQAAMSGLAGLADAIESGVARTGGTHFQQNIEESRQKQKENLLNALKAKYETGYKGQELAQGAARIAEEGRSHKANEAETEKARVLTQQAQDLSAAQHVSQLGLEKNKLEAEENKTALEQAAKTGGIWNKLKGTVGLGVPGPDPAILQRAQGKAPAAHPQDAQAVTWAKAHPGDPRAAKILKANGQ